MKASILALAVCLLASPLLPADRPKPSASTDLAGEALKKKIDHPAVSGTVKDAFVKVGKLGEVKLDVDWTALNTTGLKEDAQVNVQADEATVEQVLEMVLVKAAVKGNPLGWYVEKGRVCVSTQAVAMFRSRSPLLPLMATTGKAGKSTVNLKGVISEANFNETPLEDVISFLRNVSGANIVVNWKALEAIKVETKTPITIKASDLSVARVLDLVLDQLSSAPSKFDRAYWVIDEGVVTVSTGSALNVDLKTRVFDVGDVLVAVPNFVGPRVDIRGDQNNNTSGTGIVGSTGAGRPLFVSDDTNKKAEEEETYATQKKNLRDGLIGAVRDSIGNDMWQPTGKGSARLFRDKLIISQTLLGFKLMEQTGAMK